MDIPFCKISHDEGILTNLTDVRQRVVGHQGVCLRKLTNKRQRISPLFALARPGYVFGRIHRSRQTKLQKVCHPQYDLATSMRRTLEHFMRKPSLC
jgi:hypothetical protein